MAFGYIRPFSFKIGAQQAAVQVAAVRHGVTEITLSDGRLVRATLHVRDVKPNLKGQALSTSPIISWPKLWPFRRHRSTTYTRQSSRA
jgi:hypothetical protein